jgi:hypothetical protein
VPAIRFRKGDTELEVFTTLATPQDATVQEIRIESFVSADAASARLFRAWAGGRS